MMTLQTDPGRATQQRGATAVEYALLVALVAGVIIVAIALLGDKAFGLLDLSTDNRW